MFSGEQNVGDCDKMADLMFVGNFAVFGLVITYYTFYFSILLSKC